MQQINQIRGAALIAAAALLNGCGGSGGDSTAADNAPNAAAEQTATYGRLVTRVVGTAQPPVTLGGLGSVVTGVAGATINSVVLSDPSRTLDDTRIAYYAVGSQAPGLYLISPNATDAFRLLPNIFGTSEPCWSPDGTRLAVDIRPSGGFIAPAEISDGTSNTVMIGETPSGTNQSNITIIQADGTTRTVTASSLDTNASWWPGNRITFESRRDGNSEIYVMNADGTGVLNLTRTPTVNETAPNWSPDANGIIFTNVKPGTSEVAHFAMNDGSVRTIISSPGSDWDPQYSPDGSKIAFASSRDGNSEIYVADANGFNQTRLTVNTVSDFDPSWSPDGTRIAFTRTTLGGSPELWTMTAAGTSARRIASNAARPSWSPFVTTRTLVGRGAVMGESASGFLFGRRGDATSSLLVFSTATPGSARIEAQTPVGLNTPNFVFDVTAADAITALSFSNDFFQKPITVITAPGTTPAITGALVDFNASTGKVSAVLPYTANRSVSQGPERTGNVLIYRRRFVGVWDDSGHNLAPNGATEARFDTRTGELLSFGGRF
jgi:Tol biopolymer transport system component